MSYRVVHYINQFFANIGGEEMAHIAPEIREGFVGPGMAFNQAWKGEAEIVKTIICGDSYYAEHEKDAKAQILDWVKAEKPDMFIAGPAFNAGRYGYACALGILMFLFIMIGTLVNMKLQKADAGVGKRGAGR